MNDFLEQISALSPQRLVLLAVKLKEQLDSARRVSEEPIAVIGVGCRLPGASDPDAFWDMLENGRGGIREVPSARWSVDEYFDPDPDAPGKISTRMGGFLDHIDGFDPAFFGIAPREAATMDPQQRLLLEVTWESLENAGIAPSSLMGSRTGVYVGICNSDYQQLLLRRSPSTIDAYLASGNAPSIASGRLSYVMGLRGPCMTIDTSCSASLVAIHSACQSLRFGESSMALAGGVNVICAPETSISLSKGHMLAKDGRCKTFDAAADGFTRGEGCGMVVLKRLSDAKRDGNRILAMIRGSAINQDGKSSGLTVPNGPAQESVIRDALAAAGLSGSDIDYVEAHGTGTPLGDPIEVRALARVLGERRDPDRPLLIGSVKTNIGHLESAAGVAGFLKVVLALQHEAIPKHLNFKDPNPFIEWANLPVAVVNEGKPWLRGAIPRRAGVSSFGFSGTNAHLILEEAPAEVAPVEESKWVDRPLHCLTVSAGSEVSLRELTRLYAEAMAPEKGLRLADVAYVAGTGRSHLTHRLAIVAADEVQARAALLAAGAGEADPMVRRGKIASGQSTEVVFLYTGAGAQYPGMGNALYQASPVFREAIDHCDRLLGRDANGLTLKSVLAAATGDAAPIHEIGWAQPAMFAIEYALTKLWRSWGVVPSAVIGHSVGEYAAACAAGVFSVEDGLRLITERGRLMQSLPRGGMMAALFAPIDEIEAAISPLRDRVAIAAFNAPGSVVISGETNAVEALLADFARRNVIGQRLFVSLAAHSPLMEPALDRMEELARSVAMSPPTIPIAWNLTGRPLPNGMAPDAVYWRRHMREPVRFADGINSLYDDGFRIFLEVGPHPSLLAMAQQTLPDDGNLLLTSLRRGKKDWNELLTSLADLHVRGVPVDFAGFDRPYQRRRVGLPTYPFDRARFWAAPMPRFGLRGVDGSAPAEAETAREADGLYYKIAWEPAASQGPRTRALSELVKGSGERFGALMLEHGFEIYDRLMPDIDDLSVAYVRNALVQLQFDATPGRRLTAATEAARLGIVKRHGRLFARLLARLAETGTLRSEGDEYIVRQPLTAEDPASRCADLLTRFGAADGELQLLQRCGGHLASVLRGEQDPLQLLFQEGSLAAVRKVYAESPYARIYNGMLADFVCRAIAQQSDGRPIRVLEIGAGTGSTTSFVLPLLGKQVDYTFTDISPLFLAQAAERFGEYPLLRTATLDIERDPVVQGFEAASYDIVIAANVLHATEDMAQTMIHVSRLLAPDGKLFVVEGVRSEPWVDLTFGLTEGFWRFSDLARRRTSPLLEPDAWQLLLAETGFSNITVVPEGRQRVGRAANQALIMAALPSSTSPRRWLVLADTSDLSTRLQAALAASGDSVTIVEPDMWRTSAASPQGLRREQWWPNGPEVVDLVYLGALDTREGDDATAKFSSQLALTVLQAAAGVGSARVWLVTRGAQDVRGVDDVLAPDQAAVWGLGRTFALEHPDQWGGLLDLDPLGDTIDATTAIAAAVRANDGEDQMAWRNGARLVARLARAPQPEKGTVPIHSNATYLITGGLGGLGLEVAGWLTECGARHLVLAGRTPLPPRSDWASLADDRRVAAIVALERAGAQVEAVALDVGDASAMTALITRLSVAEPPLRGIVHAAVAPTAAPLAEMQPDLLDAMFRTKVASFRMMNALTVKQPLDFFIAFSTTTAILGVSQLAHYAAANAVVDALACRRRADGRVALSVNWGTWDKLLSVSDADRARIVRGGLRPMPSKTGFAALESLLAANATRAIVADVDWPVFSAVYEARRARPLLKRVVAAPACQVNVATDEADLQVEHGAIDFGPLAPVERREAIEVAVRAAVARVFGLDAPNLIDPATNLFTMGMDSLMAIELKARLERAVTVRLPQALAFNHPTVSALVDYLNATVAERVPMADDLDDINDLLGRLPEMSGAEVDALLEKMLAQEGRP
jgi:acyl transferase domain-containing protein/SAM-dependent methyltransferase/acyl carrier protein